MTKKTIYWICQIVGWGAYMLFIFAMMYIFTEPGNMNPSVIVLQFVIGFASLLFSHLFRLFVKKRNWNDLKPKVLVPRVILGVIILSFITQGFIHLVIYTTMPADELLPFSPINFLGYTANTFLVMVVWAAIYFAYQFVQNNRRSEIEKLELKAALNEAELAILKNQVNPHFLFNALNNIRSLILTDPEKARSMVTHISELLRYSIQFNASERVSLAQEIDIVKDYLQLESIQFDDRLTYSFEIDDSTLAIKIPPMAIQLLVENAIKHGISQLSAGGEISIHASLENDHLKIEVTNDGQLQKKSKREGVGLKNLVERLKILFGQFAELSLENSAANKVTASLKIPLL